MEFSRLGTAAVRGFAPARRGAEESPGGPGGSSIRPDVWKFHRGHGEYRGNALRPAGAPRDRARPELEHRVDEPGERDARLGAKLPRLGGDHGALQVRRAYFEVQLRHRRGRPPPRAFSPGPRGGAPPSSPRRPWGGSPFPGGAAAPLGS